MQESRLTEIIPSMCTSALWGHRPSCAFSSWVSPGCTIEGGCIGWWLQHPLFTDMVGGIFSTQNHFIQSPRQVYKPRSFPLKGNWDSERWRVSQGPTASEDWSQNWNCHFQRPLHPVHIFLWIGLWISNPGGYQSDLASSKYHPTWGLP